MKPVLIWDIPTRLFHWTLALSFAGTWFTTESDRWLSVHVFLGYLMLGLVGFRLVWGIAGSHYARFASFRFGPKAALAYVGQVFQGRAARHIGHNPAGGLAIYLLLLLTLIVGVTGFLTLGGEEQQGAMAGWMGFAQSRALKKLHEFSAWLMLLLVFGHIAGVVVESILHRENLARSMVTGNKLADAATPAARPNLPVAALMLLVMAAFAVWWFFYLVHPSLEKNLGVATDTAAPHVPFVGRKLADNAQWRDECGSCHLAFHPSLLPARSWQRVILEQDKHFGVDLALDKATAAALLAFMTENAAEKHATEPAVKINRSVTAAAVPLRITETPYWVSKHKNIAASDWQSPLIKSKANCAACHLDAEAGTFEDAAMHIPKAGGNP